MGKLSESLLNSIPKDLEFKVDVPSKGKFYSSFNPSKGITVSPFTFANEMEMSQKLNQKGFNPMDFIIEKCVHGVENDELLAMDRFAILLKIREVSFGSDYKIAIMCPNCGTENDLNFKLSELPINYIPDDLTDPQEITLPMLKVKVKVRFPRTPELNLIEIEGLDKHLWRFVVAMANDKGEYTEDKVQIAEVLNDPRFPLKDIKAIVKAISSAEYGVQTEAKYKCCKESCQSINDAVFGISPDFFS